MKHLQYKFDLCLAQAKPELLSTGLAKYLGLNDNNTKQQETAMHFMVSAEEKSISPVEFRQDRQVNVPEEFKFFTSRAPVT